MILAFDTYYETDYAHTVCLQFKKWSDKEPEDIWQERMSFTSDYVSGELYKRELPCILSLLSTIDFNELEAIVIDGFVFLDDDGKLGLGAHLYEALEERIPIIGVAKSNFATIYTLKRTLFRGDSYRPLFITSVGIDIDTATENIRNMDGAFRIPTLLKLLDRITKSK